MGVLNDLAQFPKLCLQISDSFGLVLLFQVILAQIFVAFARAQDVVDGTQDLVSYDDKCLFFTFSSDDALIFGA